jgi:nucleoside-diphosphate-sugar epimerase
MRCDYIFFGHGALSNYLISYFVRKGKSVICVTNHASSISETTNLRFLSVDKLVNTKVLADYAIFCWRESTAQSDASSEWLSTNLFGIRKSFFLSSASVYRSSEKELKEDPKNLSPQYLQNNKFLLERRLSNLLHSKEIPHTNLRITNVYGPELQHGFISSLFKSLEHKIPADVYNQSWITRDYVSVFDLCLALELLTKTETKIQVLNISTGIGTDIEGVLQVFEDLGRKISLRNYTNAPSDIKSRVILDCGLLQSTIKWNPVPLKDGISKILSQSTF